MIYNQLLLWFLLIVSGFSNHVEAQIKMETKSLGRQITKSKISGGCFYQSKTGANLIFTVVIGEPAKLLGYDISSGQLKFDIPIPGLRQSWDLAVSGQGTLYISGSNGHLYSFNETKGNVRDLGKPFSQYTVIFAIEAGDDGVIYGGTYPNCRVFSYKPNIGFRDLSKAAVVKGEEYIRSMAFDSNTKKLYLGIGNHAHLIEYDPATNEKKDLLPKRLQSMAIVYSLNLLKDKQIMFCRITGNGGEKLTVLDLKTRRFTDVKNIDVRSISYDNSSNMFWGLYKHQLANSRFFNFSQPNIVNSTNFGSIFTKSWKGGTLYMLGSRGDFIKANPGANIKIASAKLNIPKQSVKISRAFQAPNGNIWSTGLVTGGTSVHNRKTNETISLGNLGQIEGIAFLKDFVIIGTYPHCKIYKYDSKREWDVKSGNPKLIATIKGQNRPTTGVSLESLDEVFFGTTPEYGRLGGALISYNIINGKISTYDNLIPDQSIISLAKTKKNKLIGGTSIFGDLGVAPKSETAVIFGWDPITKTKTFVVKPFPKAKNIYAITEAGDGNLYGIADGVIFKFDPYAKKVLRSKKILNHINNNANNPGRIVVSKSGTLYLNTSNVLYKIDPNSLIATKVLNNVSNISVDENGKLRFSRNDKLMSLDIK